MGGTNDFETLGFLDLKELDAKGFSTAAGATPLGSHAMLSVTGSIGSFDRPSIVVELGGTSVTRVDGAAYRPIDFTAGAGTGFATTMSFEEIGGSDAKPDFSVIVTPLERPVEVVTPAAPSNLAPVFVSGSATGAEDSTISGMVVATDADGDNLTVTKLTDPVHGTVTVHADGSFDFVPAANWHGSDSFDVAVSDGKGGTVTGTVTVTATPVNDTPTAGNLSVTTNEDTATGGTLAASDVDGDSLTFSMSSGPSHGVATVNASGAWTYAPDAAFSGSDQFTVSVSDGNGGTTSIVVDLTVVAVNDVPVASDATASVAEDGSVSGTLTATDIDGDLLTWSLVSAASHGTATVAADGGWTYTPDGDFNGSDSFDATVSDGNGGARTVTVAVTVTPVNDAPSAGSPSFSTNEDIPLTISEAQLLAGASDIDGDTLSVAGLSASAGTLSDNGDGTWTLTPPADSSAPITLNWSVSDGVATIPASALVTVDAVNDAPTAADQSFTTDEDIALVGSLTASDVEGDSLTFAKASDPAHGTVTVDADGSFIYTPAADWNGTDSFGFTVSDGNGGTVTKTATITVAPINDAPAVSDVDLGSTDEDIAFEFTDADLLAAASDVDLDGLSVASVTVTSGNGSLTDLGGGDFRFVPAAGWNGHATLSFGISDGTSTTTAEATLTVDSVNDAPVGNDVSVTTDEDTATGGTLSATDSEADGLTFTKATDPAHGIATVAANGAWTYTPVADWHGTDSFTATVSDGNGGTDTITVTVAVNPVNDAPVASGAASGTTDEDVVLTGSVAASDIDGDAVSFAVQVQGAKGTASIDASGDWTYVPDPDANGADSFTVRVSDGNGGFDDHVITVTITPINDNPVAGGAATASGDEDTVLTGTVTGSDIDGDTVSFSVQSQGAKGSVTVDGSGNWTYTPVANATGADSFTIRIGDGIGGFADHMVAVTLDAVNDTPTAGNVVVTISEDGTASGTLTATDVDADSLSWSLSAFPTHGNVTVDAEGGWSYEPDADFAGSDQFTVSVSDGHGGTATVTVDLTVTPVNDAPVVADIALGSTDEDTAFDFTAADLLAGASDVDLDVLSVASVTLASGNGAVTDLGGGNFRFVPAAGWNGPVSLSFSISDGTTVTTAQATLTVTAVNDAPTAADQGFSVNEDATLNGTLTASDVDGDSLTFAKATDPAHGTVTVNADGAFNYTPNSNWNGTDSFDFTVNDGNGGIVTKAVTVTVDPIADAPTAALADASGTEDTAIALDFTGTGLSDASETLTVQISGLPADATLSAGTDLGGGVWRLTAAQLAGLTVTSSTVGVHNLTLTATSTESNGATAMASDTASLTVSAGNAAPMASDANILALKDNPVAFKLRASDPDGNPLTESLHTAPDHGTVAWDAGIGEWLYTPDAGYSGADSFVMQVDDGNGGMATSTYNVQVRSESTGLTVNAESDVVNYDSGTTNRPAIAADSDGSYAVFAADYNVAGNLVFFGADGTPTGVNVNVKPGTGTFGGDTDIAYFKDGSQRVIIVKGDETATTDGNDWGFSISVYGEDCTAVATNVVPYDPAIFANRQYDIGLAALEGANAGMAIVTFQCRYKAGWTYDTWGVVVDSDGTYGTPFQINAATTNAYESDVAALSNGGFVAAYEAPDANSTGVYMRFFNSSFAPVTGDVAVNTTTAGYQGRPEIAASSSGVAVTWVSADNMLRMRTFDTFGNATSAEIVVGPQNRYRWWDVAAHEDEFCVVWEAADSDGTGVWMQRFSIADGISLGAASLVASTETGTQARPDVDYAVDGSLVFVYDDGSANKIRTRSHSAADNTVAFVGTDGGDAVYGSSGADDFQGGLGNDVFFSGGGADIIRFGSILDGEDTLDSVDFTQGASIVLTGILTAGQLDLAHMRLEAVYGSDDTIAFEVDHDQDGSWNRLALLTNAKEATGAMNGDGNFDAVSQAQLDTALQGLIDGGQITA